MPTEKTNKKNKWNREKKTRNQIGRCNKGKSCFFLISLFGYFFSFGIFSHLFVYNKSFMCISNGRVFISKEQTEFFFIFFNKNKMANNARIFRWSSLFLLFFLIIFCLHICYVRHVDLNNHEGDEKLKKYRHQRIEQSKSYVSVFFFSSLPFVTIMTHFDHSMECYYYMWISRGQKNFFYSFWILRFFFSFCCYFCYYYFCWFCWPCFNNNFHLPHECQSVTEAQSKQCQLTFENCISDFIFEHYLSPFL